MLSTVGANTVRLQKDRNKMTDLQVIELIRQAVLTVFYVSAPPLLMGLGIGVIVSIFQTVTSIQEPTLAFIPKIVAVLLSLILFGNFMLGKLEAFFTLLFNSLPQYLSS